MNQMPRTPNEAGLIGVAVKRKKEYKNTHKCQLIDQDKLFKMLNKLKENGNKYYQFHEDYNAYKMRCREADPIGYDVVFAEEDSDSQGEIEIMGPNVHEVQDEIVEEEDVDNTELKENIDYENNDPVEKFQFQYNKSLCMTNKYPES